MRKSPAVENAAAVLKAAATATTTTVGTAPAGLFRAPRSHVYAKQGNDVSGDEDDFVAPKEIVAPQKSTKKDGVPPKADKTKAKGGKPKATGNEAGARFNNKNKDVEAPRSTQRKTTKDKKFDRHSRTGKTETAKSQNQKLGDEAESQIEGEADAEAELAEEAAEAAEEEAKPVLRSAADFFKELNNSEFSKAKPASVKASTEFNEEDLIVKKEESFIAKTAEKKLKSKPLKQKQLYAANITVSDGYDKPERPERSDFKKGRGGKKFAGKPRPAANKASA